MERWAGKIAVVTGASAGIGLATAKALVSHGLIVVGLARRSLKMECEMKEFGGKGEFHGLECDVTKEEQVKDAFKWVKEHLKTLHILVNNAGVVKLGKIEDLSFQELKNIIDVNLTGVIHCTKLATKMMKEADHESHVIMINSVIGHRVSPVPYKFSSNVYAASKYAVRALAQVLEAELYGGNIRVTNLSPGAVRSEMTSGLLEEGTSSAEIDFLEPEDISDAIIYVLGTPTRVRIEELIIKPNRAPY